MRKTVSHLSILVLALAACLAPPHAVAVPPFALDVRICNDEILELPSAKFPIGCEIIDCCPGCPGPGLLETRILFNAPIGSEARLSFAGASEQAIKALKVTGNAKWTSGPTLVVSPGESLVRGWRSDARDAPMVTPQIKVAEAALKQLGTRRARDSAQADREPEITTTLSVTQSLERFTVRNFAIRYRFRQCPPVAPAGDRIQLSNNTANDQVIALLDARRTADCVNDEVGRGNASINEGSVLSNQACRSEVVVFSDDNAVAFRENVTVWTDPLGNILQVPLPPLVREAVTFWVMQGTFADTQQRVTDDAFRANQLYNTMNGGLGFNTTAVNDATGDADTPELLNANCDYAERLRSDIGFTPGQLNVYYNRNPSARGWWCGDDTFIVRSSADKDTLIVGETANAETLSHEIGHAFTLKHSDGVAGITTKNVMWSGGTGRNMFTLGQVFRTSINQASRVNVHGLRPGEPTRNCPDTLADASCPELACDPLPR